MDNSKSQNIEICDFYQENQNIIDTNENNLLCEYTVKYTPNEDNKEDKMKEIKIKIKTLADTNCDKLNDFEVFVGIDGSALTWNATLSDNDKKEVLQYLMELKKELNQLNKEKQNKDFLNALCIMIFYYAVKENRYCRNNEWVQYMDKGDFKQYQEIIEKTIKEQETANKNDKNIVVTDNKISLKKTHPKDSDGRFCEFFNKCGCCCCRNDKTTTNNDEVILNTSLANNQGKITNIN